MSRVTLVALVVLLIGMVSMGWAAPEDSLVGYWPFDEGSGTVAGDASGNGHDGEITGDVAWTDGVFGQALDFGSGGGYVVVPDDDALDLSDAVTVAGWFNLNEPIEGQRRMMSKNNAIFLLFDFSNPTSLDFLVKPANDFVETTTVDWVVGEWYHFAGTYDGDALRIYINGVLEGEKTGVPAIATSDLDLWIGADDWQPPTTTLPGKMDDIRIYSQALTEAEVGDLMSAPTAVEPGVGKLTTTWGALRSDF